MSIAVRWIARDNPDVRLAIGSIARDLSTTAVLRRAEASGLGHDPDLWQELVNSGWAAMPVASAHGGGDGSLPDLHLVLFELGRVGAPVPYRAAVVATAMFLSYAFPDSPQAAKVAGDVVEGAVWAPAVSQGDSDPSVRLLRDTGLLEGCVDFVPAAAIASGFLTAVQTDENEVHWYAVQADADGLSVEDMHVFGPDPMYRVRFRDCRGEHIALSSTAELVLWRTLWEFADSVWANGLMSRVLEMAVTHVGARAQFGRPIGSFQAVQHRLADAVTATQGCINLSRSFAFEGDRLGVREAIIQGSVQMDVAYHASRRTAGTVVRDVHQVHGGAGFTLEHDLQLFTRRLKAFSISGESTSAVTERIVSPSLQF